MEINNYKSDLEGDKNQNLAVETSETLRAAQGDGVAEDAAQLYTALENLYGDVYLLGLREITMEDIYAGSARDAIRTLKRLQQFRNRPPHLAIGQTPRVENESIPQS